MSTREHHRLHAVRLGRTGYRWCLDLQRRAFALRGAGLVPDMLFLTEHDPVYTIGRTGNPEHVLAGERELRERNIDLVSIERGGDVTYHGPGQLVVYPILDLHGFTLDLHRYLRDLEETVIRLLSRFSLRAGRHPSYTGVWVDGEKVCAIGIHSSRWVTMHGFALNVSPDMRPFDRIIPCGIFERGVTSMERLLGLRVSLEEVARLCIVEFGAVFGVEVREVDAASVLSRLEVTPPAGPAPGPEVSGGIQEFLTCSRVP